MAPAHGSRSSRNAHLACHIDVLPPGRREPTTLDAIAAKCRHSERGRRGRFPKSSVAAGGVASVAVPVTRRHVSVSKVAGAGEEHCNASDVGCTDNIFVPNGPTGLNYC